MKETFYYKGKGKIIKKEEKSHGQYSIETRSR